MKRLLCLILACLLLAGCTPQPQLPSATYLDVFDTVTTIMGGDPESVHRQLQHYHKLFDIYNSYENLPNLKTINDNAGIAPVKVDSAIIQLLTDCLTYYRLTDGKVNVAMGAVLKLWHTAREESLQTPENAYIPAPEALAEAAKHTDIRNLVIDAEASTVYLADRSMSLDVGAVAKGWAAQKVAENAPEGMLISLGGNVVATGPKAENTPWTVGIQDPEGDSLRRTLTLEKGAMVTSGDYQRYYTVNGENYHHIIDPETGMPGGDFRSVTVICDDSAMADVLSTALFLLPLEAGKTLAGKWGAKVYWIDRNGNEYTI